MDLIRAGGSGNTEELPVVAFGEHAHLGAILLDSGPFRHHHHVIAASINPLWRFRSRLCNLPGILATQLLQHRESGR